MSSCASNPQIPNPPSTTTTTCAVRLGGSNSTILDACCNSHINGFKSYPAPGSSKDCYQYCETNDPDAVERCFSLPSNFGPYDKERPDFQCFNAVNGTGSTGDAIGRGRPGWGMMSILAMGLVGSVIGSM
ncbi:hypothetical protein P154DRAFT_425271 [Amniculicola lignicola CBS 123094]|uniref:Uncharacterized protein n=1 Tax=Amniculicola lignicola CBS 123094 TaxID=1392246 RepID=A0A6A5X127_9PLEO|nr:hypothetical protein P154DRAFT_425271 [Amniculicola lignicola CBS 123094]